MPPATTPLTKRWDIFCDVVDNYGDAAICWRLASILANAHHQNVCLWINKPAILRQLHPSSPSSLPGFYKNVEIREWPEDDIPIVLGDYVIEGFGCTLPPSVQTALRIQKPQWINLDYLSAEEWVNNHHGLSTPARNGLPPRTFFYPGFTHKTGGLLREPDLIKNRDAFYADTQAKDNFRIQLGLPPHTRNHLLISFFSYADADYPGFLTNCLNASSPVTIVAPDPRNAAPLHQALIAMGSPSSITLCTPPFLDMDSYDKLLWIADLNFVRGEDSFVRAQWAEKPFIWQAYPQMDNHHLAKVDAFMALYTDTMPCALKTSLCDFHHRWNTPQQSLIKDTSFLSLLPDLQFFSSEWCTRQLKIDSLTETLCSSYLSCER